MNKTAVMTDTNSGISVEEGRERGIFVLPMPVIVDGKDHLEGKDLTHADMYTAMKAGKEVKSSQPSLGDVMAMWDDILKSGYDEIIYVPMSSGLSGSCHTSAAAAADYDGKVLVADNHRIAVTLRESVLDAKHHADNGLSALDIKHKLEANAYNSVVFLAVDTLEYFKKSGRITPAAATIATVLNIKPVLVTRGEKFDTLAKVRGTRASREKLIESAKAELEGAFAKYPYSQLKVSVAGSFETDAEAKEWQQLVQKNFPKFKVSYDELSCSIVCHTGIGAAGLGISVIEYT